MRTVLLITARLKSRRLPRKIVLPLGGKPAILRMLDRVRQASTLDDVIVCTSTHPEDTELCDLVTQAGGRVFRGSEDDVLQRLSDAAAAAGAGYVINATADNPLLDPEYIDRMVQAYQAQRRDLITAYQLPRGAYGWGLDVEALRKVCRIKAEQDTEVWGPYFTDTGLFDVLDLPVDAALRRPELRLTLDYPEDYELLRQVFERLGAGGRAFTLRDVIALLDAEPALAAINRHCQQLYEQHLTRSAAVRLKPQAAEEPAS